MTKNSEQLLEKAKQYIPGGVNSPVRAFHGVGGTPVFFDSAQGAYLTDVAGKRYIDYVGSWGPMILGHQHPDVVAAVQHMVAKAMSFGAPCELEIAVAEQLCTLLPSLEQVRMVNSGTEAAMSAIRLARGFTHRNKIIKFDGCYHGHADALLVKAGSGGLTFGVPSSAGVPADFTQHTVSLPFNDLNAIEEVFTQQGDDVAAIIVEPIAANMNCVLPQPGFLEGLRALCDQHGAVLIFDEVITGFRVALDGAQGYYNVKPDLTILGKIIGGGMPVGAFGGRRDIMATLSPEGPVYQAGTLSGNPVAMAAGFATLKAVQAPDFYTDLTQQTARLCQGLTHAANDAGVALHIPHVGGLFGLLFTTQTDIRRYEDIAKCDQDVFKRFYHGMLEQGIYFAPSNFEAGFMSAAHGEVEIEATISAAKQVFAAIGSAAYS